MYPQAKSKADSSTAKTGKPKKMKKKKAKVQASYGKSKLDPETSKILEAHLLENASVPGRHIFPAFSMICRARAQDSEAR